MNPPRRLQFAATVAAVIAALLIGARMVNAPAPPALAAGGGREMIAAAAPRQPSVTPHAARRGEAGAQPEIIGGAPVPVGTYRFMTYITEYGGQLCGGALITPYHVLTAAHCVDSASAGNLMTYVGGNVKSGGIPQGGYQRTVTQIAVHPLWNPVTKVYDAAVLTLGEAVPPAASGGVDPLPLTGSGASTGLGAGTWLTVAGWGLTNVSPTVIPTQLKAVNVQVQSDLVCANNGPTYDPAMMFCAGPVAGGEDSCQGDSGGPIFLNSGGSLTEIGIVSWGVGCAAPGYPGVYSKIANPTIYNFIMTAIGAPIPTPTPVPDTTGPTVTIKQPKKGDTEKSPFTVKVRASDASGVRKVELERCVRKACQRIGTDASAPYSFRVDEPKGKVTIRAKATDMVGNIRYSKKVSVTVE